MTTVSHQSGPSQKTGKVQAGTVLGRYRGGGGAKGVKQMWRHLAILKESCHQEFMQTMATKEGKQDTKCKADNTSNQGARLGFAGPKQEDGGGTKCLC